MQYFHLDAVKRSNDEIVPCLGKVSNTFLCYFGFVAMGTDASDKKEGTTCIFIKALHKYFLVMQNVWKK